MGFLKKRYTKVKIGGVTINAELADSVLKRAKGLMGRKSLGEKEGMLFLFEREGYHKFWMMNMMIPIDIIFIDKNKTVVDVVKNAKPGGLICEKYKPKNRSMYVLEDRANFTERNRVRSGSKLNF